MQDTNVTIKVFNKLGRLTDRKSGQEQQSTPKTGRQIDAGQEETKSYQQSNNPVHRQSEQGRASKN